MAYPTLVQRITELVKYQLPAFIREDHQNFIAFMEAYYEWMETKYQGNIQPYYGSANLINFSDLDKTLTQFIEYFSKEFLVHIPTQILCDRKKLLKNIKSFYRSRGNEKAFELLFRIMYQDTINFYYPTVDTIKADDGKWVLKKAIRCVRQSIVQPFDLNVEFIGKKIIGNRSGATGIVDYIINYDAGYATVHEIFFKKNTVYGFFVPLEDVSVEIGDSKRLQIQPILTNINLTYAGSSYTRNSPVTITNPYGIKMEAFIRDVDGDTGAILNVQILNPGLGYPVYPVDETTEPKVTFENHDLATATADAEIGALFEYPGYYVTTDGFPDSIEKLRDDYFYQEYSYVIRSHINLSDWYDVVHKIVHPAGTIVFNNLLIEPDSIFVGPSLGDGRGVSVLIRMPVTEIVSTVNLPENSFYLEHTIEDGLNQEYSKIGSIYRSIDRDAFRNIPTQMFPTNMLILPNDYLVNYANYSLVDLGDLRLDDLLIGTKKTNTQPRVTVKIGFHVKGIITTLLGSIPLSDIQVNITGPGVSLQTTTNSFGEFFFDGLSAGTYDVTPTDPNWDFGPTSLSVVLSTTHEDNANFQAEALINYISGTITNGGSPVPFVDVYLTGEETDHIQTGPTGEYVFSNLSNGLYTITPSLSGYTFDPDHSDIEFEFGGPDNIEVDFEANSIECSITGTITVGGLPLQFVDVDLTGDATQTTQTDINGEFTFTGLLIGSYTITPFLIGYEFTPDHDDITFTLGGPYDVTSDFTAVSVGNYISGTVTEGGSPLPDVDMQLVDLNLDLSGFDVMPQVIINDGTHWYVGGGFTSYKGTTTHDIAKINMSTGALDPTFSTGAGFSGYAGEVRALAISGNDLYAGGYFTAYQGTTRGAIAKLNATTGALDATFNANPGCIGSPSPVVNGIIISGGYLYLSGAMLQYNGTTRQRICKVNATTAALDATFNTSTGFDSETHIMVLDGNDLYVGGGFTTYKGSARQYIAKLNATTAALDGTFDSAVGFNNKVRGLAKNGTDLYCSGEFTAYKGSTRQYIAKINTSTAALNGAFDSSSGFNANCRKVELDVANNKIFCCGDFTSYNGITRQRIAKLDMTTAILDNTFDTTSGFDNIVLAMNIWNGDVYAVGAFTQYHGYTRQRLAKINATYGFLDTIQIAVVGDITNGDGFYIMPYLSNSSYLVKPIWTGDVYTPSHVYVTILNNHVENVDFSKA